mmetsp:Transcript_109621/g.320846  ORF Transcript_109621/g.320846 Transcript_109621/m.320846 type:complete len:208 (+) Transcript_109621:348-971(+)
MLTISAAKARPLAESWSARKKVTFDTFMRRRFDVMFLPLMSSVVILNRASTRPAPSLCASDSSTTGVDAVSESTMTLSLRMPAAKARAAARQVLSCSLPAKTGAFSTARTRSPTMCLGWPPVALASGRFSGFSSGWFLAAVALLALLALPALPALPAFVALEALEAFVALPALAAASGTGAKVALSEQEACPHIIVSLPLPMQGSPP